MTKLSLDPIDIGQSKKVGVKVYQEDGRESRRLGPMAVSALKNDESVLNY